MLDGMCALAELDAGVPPLISNMIIWMVIEIGWVKPTENNENDLDGSF